MTNPKTAKLAFLSAILIYGTLGVFVRYAGQPSALVALARSSIGTLFLLFLLAVKRQKIDFSAIRRNWKPLLIAGVLLGLNWVTLFEAYRYTTVAVATLCTYLNPIIIVFGAAILMHEQLTARKLLCFAVALIGMVFVSGVADSGLPDAGEAKGILLGLLTAVLYGCIVLSNKQLRDISAYDRTLVQLFITTLVLIPYCILHGDFVGLQITGGQLALLLILGVVHTGFAYRALAGDDLIKAGRQLADRQRLDDAVHADGLGERSELVRVEGFSGLQGIGLDLLQRQADRALRRRFGLLIDISEQGAKALAETFLRCHSRSSSQSDSFARISCATASYAAAPRLNLS